MTEPRLTREAIQIAKAVAAARSQKRFRPLVTPQEMERSIRDLKAAIAVVDTWKEIATMAGEQVLDYMIALGTAYLRSGGFNILTDMSMKGIQSLVDYLQQKSGEVLE